MLVYDYTYSKHLLLNTYCSLKVVAIFAASYFDKGPELM